ncbi:MAG: hypothetical protein EBS68_07435 [Rhodobacteraceae bacterium]|nr:hypothetical protein [Paracoccaceae bacterium]
MTEMTTNAAEHHTDTQDTSTTEKRLLVSVLFAVLAWGLSFWTWGVPGLYIPAVAMVPVMYTILIVISRG